MNRRDFVKGMLGTAVVATLPAPVITAITETVTKDIEEEVDGKHIFKKDNVLFLIKDDKVLGRAYQFTLSVQNPLIETLPDNNGWRQFERGPIRWEIQDVVMKATDANNAKKLVEMAHKMEPVDIVIITPEYKITGQAFAERATYMFPVDQSADMPLTAGEPLTLISNGELWIEFEGIEI